VRQIVASKLPDLGTLAHTAVALPFAILLGALSWRFIEKPALAFKGAFAGPKIGVADEPMPRT
jgi:peptidoglycan/LPS O-acetylase OafA/YrhL